MQRRSEAESPLSVNRAYVVQFRADTRINRRYITGRVEHLTTRAVTYFASLEELLAFFHQVLQQTGDPDGAVAEGEQGSDGDTIN